MQTKDIHVEVLQIAGIPVSFSCDIDLKKIHPAGAFDTYQLFRLNLDAHKLSLLPAFDTLLALNLSRGIVPFEHQINSVKKLLGRFRGRGMLCDEVGLGKTIEASLAMLELITRGLIKKILILVPPSLIEQWKEETFFKFNLEFITSDDKDFKAHGNAAWGKSDRIIASIHTAKKSPHADAIKQEDFDLCATYLSGFQAVMKVIQSESMRTFSFVDHGKDGAKKVEPKMPPFQPYNFRIWTFAFKVRVTTDIIEDHLYAVSIDARTLKVVKNFTEYFDKFQHLPQYEEAIPDYQPQDFQKYYQSALEYVKQKVTSLITRKKQEATDLKLKETERIKKYYDTLNEEMEDALEKKAGDREALAAIQSKQKAVLAQRQSSLDDIEFRYKMSAGMSLVSVLVTNYPCYVSKACVPSVLQPSGYDVIWNPLFKRFEPLACPACKNQSYALHFLRTGIRCQNCLKN